MGGEIGVDGAESTAAVRERASLMTHCRAGWRLGRSWRPWSRVELRVGHGQTGLAHHLCDDAVRAKVTDGRR